MINWCYTYNNKSGHKQVYSQNSPWKLKAWCRYLKFCLKGSHKFSLRNYQEGRTKRHRWEAGEKNKNALLSFLATAFARFVCRLSRGAWAKNGGSNVNKTPVSLVPISQGSWLLSQLPRWWLETPVPALSPLRSDYQKQQAVPSCLACEPHLFYEVAGTSMQDRVKGFI